jgi:hypothetical protein
MASKAELEQQVQDLTEERDLAVARLTTLQRESTAAYDGLSVAYRAGQARITELESLCLELTAQASLLALRSLSPTLFDRVTAAKL